jgi:hypothetical protein
MSVGASLSPSGQCLAATVSSWTAVPHGSTGEMAPLRAVSSEGVASGAGSHEGAGVTGSHEGAGVTGSHEGGAGGSEDSAVGATGWDSVGRTGSSYCTGCTDHDPVPWERGMAAPLAGGTSPGPSGRVDPASGPGPGPGSMPGGGLRSCRAADAATAGAASFPWRSNSRRRASRPGSSIGVSRPNSS